MASRGFTQLDINDQRQRLRKLEKEIQKELAELSKGSHITNKRQKSPRIYTPNKLLGPNKRSQTPQPYYGQMRVHTEERMMHRFANQTLDETDHNQSNLGASEDLSKAIDIKGSMDISKEHLNNIMQQLQALENSYDNNAETTNYDQSFNKTPVRVQKDRKYREHMKERGESPQKSSDRLRALHNVKKAQKNVEGPGFDRNEQQFLKQYGKSFDYRLNDSLNNQETTSKGYYLGQAERSPLKQNSRSPTRIVKSGLRSDEISVFGKKEKSREIASRMGNPLERLINGHLPSKYRQNEVEKYPFRPQINRISEALDEHFRNAIFNGDELHRWDQLYLMRDKYKIERELKRIEHEKEQLINNECTFAPNILSPLQPYDNQRSQKTDVVHRSYQWAKQREQRLQKDREEREQRDLDECTFQPDLEKERAKLGLAISKSDANIHERPFIVEGLEKHFERIDQAKRIKLQKQAIQSKYEGQSWENVKTKPKAPYLGRKSDLRRQVSISPVKKLTGYKYSRSPNRLNASHNKENMGSIFLDQSRSAFIDDVEDEEKFTDAIAELHEELHKIEMNRF